MKKLLMLSAMIMSLCLGMTVHAGEQESQHITVPLAVVGETVSPNTEHYKALQFLRYRILRDERKETVFWSFYGLDESRLEQAEKLLNAAALSHSAGNRPVKVNRVPGSKTLFWANIDDYNWKREAWEEVSAQDPYFREPWVNDEDADEFRRLGGNSVISGAWFIVHIFDAMKQEDVDLNPIGPILLYSNLGGAPKNLAEFRAIWGVNDKRVNFFGQAIGTIIPKGASSVARNERQIAVTGTDLGYYAETNDNKNGTRRYIDNLLPVLSRPDRDAAEAITTNGVQWQVYWLTAFGKGNAANEKSVNFADPTVAVDTSGHGDDVRVRMILSCISCHSNGLNTAPNAVQDLLSKRIAIYTEDRDLRNQLEAFYLRDFNEKVLFYRQIYESAVKRDTGWEPSEFVKNLQEFVTFYDRPLDIAQAAREAGVTEESFRAYTEGSPNATLTGLHRGLTVPRDAWEIGDSSVFVETMLLIHRNTIFKTEEKKKNKPPFSKEELRVQDPPVTNTEQRKKLYFDVNWYNKATYRVFEATVNENVRLNGSIVIARGSTVYVYIEGVEITRIFYGPVTAMKWIDVPNHILITTWGR